MSEVAHGLYHREHTSIWPVVVTLGLALLFWGIAANLLLGLGGPFSSGIIPGLVVLVGGIAGWLKETISDAFLATEEPPGEIWPFVGVSKLKLGTWMFLGGDIVLFGVVLGTDIYLRLKAVTWPSGVFSVPMGTQMTYILLASVLTFAYGLNSIRKGSTTGLRLGLVATLLLGAGFLGLKAVEWSTHFGEGFTLSSGLAATTYYFTTGLHGLHVLIGIIGLLYFLVASMKGSVTKELHEPLALFGLYWIFVDIVWLFVFPLIYLW
jgi:cytochrome c oxidase subunit I+III